MPLTATIGPAQVIEIHDPSAITLDELRRHLIRPGARVLFKTRNSLRRWGEQDFMEDFVYLTTEAARWRCTAACADGRYRLPVGRRVQEKWA